MIFNNIDYKNQFIDIKKQRIQIDKIGLYIVKGANGSGKSSIIKNKKPAFPSPKNLEDIDSIPAAKVITYSNS